MGFDALSYMMGAANAGSGGSGLPDVTPADNGKVLGVKNAEWTPVRGVMSVEHIKPGNDGDVSFSGDLAIDCLFAAGVIDPAVNADNKFFTDDDGRIIVL